MGSTAAIERGLRVGELAEAVGATSDTIRYYERAGLLPPPRRTPAGYRTYDVLAVDRLRFIQGAQRLGLRLADIRDLLSVRDTGSCALLTQSGHELRWLRRSKSTQFSECVRENGFIEWRTIYFLRI